MGILDRLPGVKTMLIITAVAVLLFNPMRLLNKIPFVGGMLPQPSVFSWILSTAAGVKQAATEAPSEKTAEVRRGVVARPSLVDRALAPIETTADRTYKFWGPLAEPAQRRVKLGPFEGRLWVVYGVYPVISAAFLFTMINWLRKKANKTLPQEDKATVILLIVGTIALALLTIANFQTRGVRGLAETLIPAVFLIVLVVLGLPHLQKVPGELSNFISSLSRAATSGIGILITVAILVIALGAVAALAGTSFVPARATGVMGNYVNPILSYVNPVLSLIRDINRDTMLALAGALIVGIGILSIKRS